MNTKNLSNLQEIIKQLRGPNGCPWDKKQTMTSLLKYIRAETDELIEAIEKNDQANICEELGDVLYLIYMVSNINEEEGNFDLDQVAKGINEKLIRRHPHVFAGATYANEEELAQQWEAIKAEEKAEKASSHNTTALLFSQKQT